MINEKRLAHLWGILFFCLPFSHPLLLWYQNNFINGKFTLWSNFFLQFQDFILLIILISSISFIYKHKKLITPQISAIFYLILIYLVALLFICQDPVLQLLNTIHLFFVLLSLAFFSILKINWSIISKYFLASMLFVSFLAISQIYLQTSLGFYYLGEPYLSPKILGVAKIDFNNIQIIRAYGTLAHPNILAFFSIIAFYLAQNLKLKYSKWIFIIPLLLSFSRSAWLVFIISLFWANYKITKKDVLILTSILVLFISQYYNLIVERLNIFDNSLSERWQGIKLAIQMLIANPLGVGIQHFTFYIQTFNEKILFPWEIQPVHNVYLLMTNEIGIIPMLVWLFFLKKAWQNSLKWQKPILLAILILGFFDHYLWTNYSARFLMLFFLVNAYQNNLSKL